MTDANPPHPLPKKIADLIRRVAKAATEDSLEILREHYPAVAD